jgi:hypothetical protein
VPIAVTAPKSTDIVQMFAASSLLRDIVAIEFHLNKNQQKMHHHEKIQVDSEFPVL